MSWHIINQKVHIMAYRCQYHIYSVLGELFHLWQNGTFNRKENVNHMNGFENTMWDCVSEGGNINAQNLGYQMEMNVNGWYIIFTCKIKHMQVGNKSKVELPKINYTRINTNSSYHFRHCDANKIQWLEFENSRRECHEYGENGKSRKIDRESVCVCVWVLEREREWHHMNHMLCFTPNGAIQSSLNLNNALIRTHTTYMKRSRNGFSFIYLQRICYELLSVKRYSLLDGFVFLGICFFVCHPIPFEMLCLECYIL